MSSTRENSDAAVPALPENVRDAAVQYLRSMAAAGVQYLPAAGDLEFNFATTAQAAAAAMKQAEASAEPSVGASTNDATAHETAHRGEGSASEQATAGAPQRNLISTSDAYGPALEREARVEKLNVLAAEVAQCQRCPQLCTSRTNTVFGVGSVTPRLVFFGEGPGADEDRLGEPFVGAAGQLLNKIIGAMTLAREDVYIMNTVKCRPPGNRNPSESELENCQEFYEQQFDILQPEFIVCLGSVAARKLLATKQSVGRMRGKFFEYRSSQVLVTYHPAYLLRTPQAKRQVWDDMKFLMKAMGLETA